MKISALEEYGLRCLIQLARTLDRSLSITEIAEREGMSSPYVAKLLSILRQEGLVESVRGRSGGYRLVSPPTEIRVGQILKALSQPMFEDPAYCERHAGTETSGLCIHHGQCSLRALWQTMEDWMQSAMDHITLADLLGDQDQLSNLLRTRLLESVQQLPKPLIPLTTMDRVASPIEMAP